MEFNDGGIKMKGKNGMFTPASFSHTYQLRTVQQSNDKGTWFGWEVQKIGPVIDANPNIIQSSTSPWCSLRS